MKYSKKNLKEIADWLKSFSNKEYLSHHPEIKHFEFPKYFYFKYLPDRHTIHWAIIKPFEDKVKIYFINDLGRIFDELEYKSKKIAKRRLRRNGFNFSTNDYCPFTPPEPIYIQLSYGKKSAPYSKGNLWHSVQRDNKHFNKIKNAYFKQMIRFYCERTGETLYTYKTKNFLQKSKDHNDFKNKDITTKTCNKTSCLGSNRKYINNKNKFADVINIIIAILFVLVFILSALGY